MKIAIVGAGIVGSTAAYYLSKEKGVEVTVFDHGLGQATKAAAGIISPWFSKRRNKAWYRWKMQRLLMISCPAFAYGIAFHAFSVQIHFLPEHKSQFFCQTFRCFISFLDQTV